MEAIPAGITEKRPFLCFADNIYFNIYFKIHISTGINGQLSRDALQKICIQIKIAFCKPRRDTLAQIFHNSCYSNIPTYIFHNMFKDVTHDSIGFVW